MDREIKFSYLWQHLETGKIVNKIWTLAELETGTQAEQCDYEWRCKYKLLARRQYTGQVDELGKDVYEKDIVEFDTQDGTVRGIIEYGDCLGAFVIVYTEGDSKPDMLYEIGIETTRVVGDTFTTPELLMEVA